MKVQSQLTWSRALPVLFSLHYLCCQVAFVAVLHITQLLPQRGSHPKGGGSPTPTWTLLEIGFELEGSLQPETVVKKWFMCDCAKLKEAPEHNEPLTEVQNNETLS